MPPVVKYVKPKRTILVIQIVKYFIPKDFQVRKNTVLVYRKHLQPYLLKLKTFVHDPNIGSLAGLGFEMTTFQVLLKSNSDFIIPSASSFVHYWGTKFPSHVTTNSLLFCFQICRVPGKNS